MTLSVSPVVVTYGQVVQLSGAIDPAAAGETIEIVDGHGNTVAGATTDPSGIYSVSYTPQANVTLHALWLAQAADSVAVDVGVRVDVSLHLGRVRLFGHATARGTLAPPHPGDVLTVAFFRNGSQVATRQPQISGDGSFSARLDVTQPGSYRARATFSDSDHLQGTGWSTTVATPLPTLHDGSRSAFVRLLERRLRALHYHLTGVDELYDFRTNDAVLAFRKVEGMRRVNTVDAAVWRALADPLRPRPVSTTSRFHIEVDLSRQVLFTVKAGKVTSIVHVSTGKPSTPTVVGTFHVYEKIPGMNASGMYYSDVFHGNYAIHGYADVPAYAASHGCVRLPMWEAKWIYGLATIGTPVVVYP